MSARRRFRDCHSARCNRMDKAFNFELLFKHSNDVALTTRRTLKKEIGDARSVFNALGGHFNQLQKKPVSYDRNVKMALTARFINNRFSTLMLIERGLILDAFNCSRNAMEITAFYWLVCHDKSSASLYDGEKSPQPVEVRKKLESIGVDIMVIRDLYSLESSIAHVGNKYDNLQIKWDAGKNGELMIGGGCHHIDVQREMLVGITLSIFRFLKFDEDYIVPDIDAISTVVSK